jgi:starch-binding outer membrane protein, SusD/RagB family
MRKIVRAVSRTAAGAVFVLGATACGDDFVTVTNPNVIDAATVDPTASGALLAFSAQQNFVDMFGVLAMYGGWFSGEANVSDTFPTRNEFGIRNITDLNGSLNGDVWAPLSRAIASAKTVLDLELPNPTSNLSLARAATFRGFAMLQMASDFCTGTFSSGPELNTNAMLDSASFWFTRAIEVGRANATADGVALANASLVGRARAKLQRGDNAGAAADANAVPAGFTFNLRYTDDLANRNRLSNDLWIFSFTRGSISVAPWYRQNDPRVTYRVPGGSPPPSAVGQDDVPGGFHQQTKFPGFDSPMRLASKLEADYIAAEASANVEQQLALIAARRAANGRPAYSGPTDAASVKTELFNQRALEFYLEGKRVADFRRSPTSVAPTVTAAGQPYFKPGYGNTGTDTCYPIPRTERDNNPNMSGGSNGAS